MQRGVPGPRTVFEEELHLEPWSISSKSDLPRLSPWLMAESIDSVAPWTLAESHAMLEISINLNSGMRLKAWDVEIVGLINKEKGYPSWQSSAPNMVCLWHTCHKRLSILQHRSHHRSFLCTKRTFDSPLLRCPSRSVRNYLEKSIIDLLDLRRFLESQWLLVACL